MRAENGRSGGGWEPGPQLRAAWRGALDLIFPTDAELPNAVGAHGLASEIWAKIQFIDGPVCEGCGAPFDYDRGPGVRCAACMAKPRAFDAARAACLYDEVSRDPILKLKHADRTDLAPLLVRWLSRAAADLLAEAEAIAPIPLHRWRLLGRRYNQAAELARPLAGLWDKPYLADALVRRRATDSQAGKSASGRRRNLVGAFHVPERRRFQVEGRRILLVDDVMTTGATLEGCARALKQAGASRVDVAVLARVNEGPTLPI